MPARFSRAEVQAIAALANLQLDDAELDLFARQLGDILEHATRVQNIDTEGVPATAYVVTSGSERADTTTPSLDRAAALANAPDANAGTGLFRVPQVIG